MYAMHSATTGKSFSESWVSETTASFTFFLELLPFFPVDGSTKVGRILGANQAIKVMELDFGPKVESKIDINRMK